MECIVLRVDTSISKAWRKTTPEIRAFYEKKIRAMLSDLSKMESDQLTDPATTGTHLDLERQNNLED